MATSGNFWGGANTSKDYLMMLAGNTPIAKPSSLVGHSFSNFNVDQIDRVTATSVRLVRGKIVEVQRVLRPARQTQVTFTVGFGSEGEVYTPLLQRVRRGNCELTIYMKRLCAADDEFAHFYVIRDAVFNPPTFTTDLITTGDDTNVVTQQSDVAAPEMILSFGVRATQLANLVPPLYAVAVMTQQCEDCDEGFFNEFVVGGGAAGGADDAYLAITDDRFTNITVPTTGIADGNAVTSLYADGNVILAGFGDTADPTTAITGGTAFSSDRGVSWQLDVGITEAVFGVTYYESKYYAVGGTGAGGAHMWSSDDGVNWTEIVAVVLPAGEQLTSVAVDTDDGVMYITGTGGTFLVGTISGEALVLQAIVPTGAGSTDLYRVAVFGNEHVAVGGASNFYAETFDGGDEWQNPGIPGSGAVRGLAGTSYIRAVVGAGTIIADRSILTDNQYQTLTPAAGVTVSGNYTDVASLPGEHEYFIAVTTAGEIMLVKSNAPGS